MPKQLLKRLKILEIELFLIVFASILKNDVTIFSLANCQQMKTVLHWTQISEVRPEIRVYAFWERESDKLPASCQQMNYLCPERDILDVSVCN